MMSKKPYTATIKAVVAMMLAIMMIALAGCSTDKEKPQSVAVVVQNTANVPRHTGAFAEGHVRLAQETHGYLDVVICDGSPTSAVGGGAIVGSAAESSSRADLENEAQYATIMSVVGGCRALVPEVDVMAAIEYANRSLASAPADGKRTVLICSSGLSTSGLVDFARSAGMVTSQADEVAAFYSEKGLLPNLGNIDSVVWFGLGDVAGDQGAPDAAVKANLQEIWTALLGECGVDDVVFDEALAEGEYAADEQLPGVSTVELPASPVFQGSFEEEVVLDDLTLRFVPNTAEFQDRAQAVEVLSSYADAMKAESSVTLTCYGSTAGYPWDEGFAQRLSEDRASAVKDVLVEHGVDPSRISVVGYADKAPEHVPDIDEATGLQIPDKASQNRWVKLVFAA